MHHAFFMKFSFAFNNIIKLVAFISLLLFITEESISIYEYFNPAPINYYSPHYSRPSTHRATRQTRKTRDEMQNDDEDDN